MEDVIQTHDLVKRYDDLVAVDHISLSVPRGSFFGILGPNGAGKTTLLELIEGIREPGEGDAFILGMKSWPRNTALLPKIGVQLQSSSFFERLTCIEQLNVIADLYGVAKSRCGELLERVGLSEKANTRTENLSGGQKQRLAIAASFLHSPEVVFLDEPTAALDPQARRNLWELLTSLNDEGRTVVLTTHYMDEAESLCDQVAIIDHGKILTVDKPADMVRELDAPTHILLPEGNIDEQSANATRGVIATTVEEGTITLSTKDPTTTIAALAERGALNGLQVKGATLEDVFLNLTGREYRA